MSLPSRPQALGEIRDSDTGIRGFHKNVVKGWIVVNFQDMNTGQEPLGLDPGISTIARYHRAARSGRI
jgi:hypothetical protein